MIMLRIHRLKCWPEYFKAVSTGQKPFEIRLNDRDYHVGDLLVLEEWDPTIKNYTGEYVRATITYLLWPAPDLGICEGYVIMGLDVHPLYHNHPHSPYARRVERIMREKEKEL